MFNFTDQMTSWATTFAILITFFSLIGTSVAAKPFLIVSDTYPPYEYQENGIIVGFDVEILKAVSKEADIECDIKFFPWKRAMMMIESGKADGIFSMAHSKERENFVYFPPEHLSIGKKRIFANSNFKGDILAIQDLDGKRIGIVRGNTYGEKFDNYNACIKDEAENPDMLFKKLNVDRYSLVIENENVAAFTIKKLSLKGIRPLSFIPHEVKYYIGISKKSKRAKELLDKISNALLRMKKSGKLEAIRNKYR